VSIDYVVLVNRRDRRPGARPVERHGIVGEPARSEARGALGGGKLQVEHQFPGEARAERPERRPSPSKPITVLPAPHGNTFSRRAPWPRRPGTAAVWYGLRREGLLL